MNNIDILEQLATAVEQAGANLAPTYQEYMPLAFAVANSCGEQGRSLFHRICRMSEKYRQEDADKLYDHALQNGRSGNSLGTVFHLAERAGVRLDKKLANLQNLQKPLAPTHTYAKDTSAENEKRNAKTQTPPDLETAPNPYREAPHPLPGLPCYCWPGFLQQIVDCGESPAQRDILLLGAVTVFGATINRIMSIVYSRKFNHPCLQTFIIAPPASGKGVLTWVRRLAEPIHESLMDAYYEKMKAYRQEKTQWDLMGKEKANVPEPEQPRMKMFLIAGDNSGSGMLENLIDADGAGLICETEADTVSTAIGTDYGHWSDTLRKSFDHERLAFNRRTNHEYRECKKSYLSVLLSGTPAQVKPLIPSAENGLFSRQVFYYMPPINEWTDQFDLSDISYDQRFTAWGNRWKRLLDSITAAVSGIHLKLSEEQRREFNLHLSQVFSRAGIAHGEHMKSTVARIAVNICRIMSVVALLRSLDALLMSDAAEVTEISDSSEKSAHDIVRKLMSCPGLTPSPHTPRENVTDGVVSQFDLTVSTPDFQAVLSLADPLYQHSCHILSFLPTTEVVQQAAPQEAFMDRLPLSFTRSRAIEVAAQHGIPANTLDSLLKRMSDKGRLIKTARGEYEFASHVRTRVCGCGDAASFASLQVSTPQPAKGEGEYS